MPHIPFVAAWEPRPRELLDPPVIVAAFADAPGDARNHACAEIYSSIQPFGHAALANFRDELHQDLKVDEPYSCTPPETVQW